MLRSTFAVVTLLAISGAALAGGKFSGELKFTQKGCETTGQCTLASKFGYTDSDGLGWEAAAGDKTDGASIPEDLKPYFGNSFDADLIRAAVIHDHYCDRRVRRWYNTHWVFYDALLASGVSEGRAELMLLGILIGGPKWIWLIRGKPCSTGHNCVQQIPTLRLPAGGSLQSNGDGESQLYSPARYSDPEFRKEMEIAKQKLDQLGPGQKPKKLLEIAKSIRPNDEFLNGPDELKLPPLPPGVVDR